MIDFISKLYIGLRFAFSNSKDRRVIMIASSYGMSDRMIARQLIQGK